MLDSCYHLGPSHSCPESVPKVFLKSLRKIKEKTNKGKIYQNKVCVVSILQRNINMKRLKKDTYPPCLRRGRV